MRQPTPWSWIVSMRVICFWQGHLDKDYKTDAIHCSNSIPVNVKSEYKEVCKPQADKQVAVPLISEVKCHTMSQS